ncbi:hypothetical protein ABZ897_37820 [Nonomuraea sp. NPDC046802]|uniref:hypothetical protein n=1 Tax=Nonomuraea sp. NPDC046802 TaxID=3154919 RepID=UPI0033FD32B3
MNRISKVSLSALAGAVVLAGGIFIPSVMAAGAPQAARPGADSGNPTVMGHGLEIIQSETADHWVSGAEHVVAYTVSQETEQPPQAVEVEREEGLTYRTVHARIDKVLWSKDGARKPPEGAWNFTTYGFAFNDNDGPGKSKFALEGRPRVEVGHTYIAALRWRDDPCSDDLGKGSWGSLGSGAILPFDGEIIGQGEYEGEVRSAAQNRALMAENTSGEALAEKLAGQKVDALMAELKQAKPIEGFGSGLTETCDPEDAAE